MEIYCIWMERDALFAEEIRRPCTALQLPRLLTDDATDPAQRLQQAVALLGL